LKRAYGGRRRSGSVGVYLIGCLLQGLGCDFALRELLWAKSAVQADSDREFVGGANILNPIRDISAAFPCATRRPTPTGRHTRAAGQTLAGCIRHWQDFHPDLLWTASAAHARTICREHVGQGDDSQFGRRGCTVAQSSMEGADIGGNRGGDAGFIAAPCKVCPFPTHLHHPTGQWALAHVSTGELRCGPVCLKQSKQRLIDAVL
jgi:hypothetical protein